MVRVRCKAHDTQQQWVCRWGLNHTSDTCYALPGWGCLAVTILQDQQPWWRRACALLSAVLIIIEFCFISKLRTVAHGHIQSERLTSRFDWVCRSEWRLLMPVRHCDTHAHNFQHQAEWAWSRHCRQHSAGCVTLVNAAAVSVAIPR